MSKFGKEVSETKAVVYFINGTGGNTDNKPRTFYSRDKKHKNAASDRDYGIKALIKMINEFGHRAETAIIYDTQTGEELAVYKRGIKVR